MCVFDAGNGQVSDGLRCWDYCVAQGAQILSNSWGASSHVVAMDSAIAAVTSSGALVVCSAGNDGVDVDTTPHYPSSYAENNAQVISVAASDASNNLWLRSNYGVKGGVTLAAPGVELLGLGLAGLYGKSTGTSMSSKSQYTSIPCHRYSTPPPCMQLTRSFLLHRSPAGCRGRCLAVR